MKITINGEAKELRDGLSITELLVVENVEMPEMVSVQLNDEFLKQDEYAATIVKEGDDINFLYFMGGGA
ncbi:MAG: sulfur carrier protein ThiS [Sulfurospirillaceae bacterium]|nr:sulfur carrier protein ThiS [Sulfurospirillaceae bacterium]